MSSPVDPRPALSIENSDRLSAALLLCEELQRPAPDSETKLIALRSLLNECRKGVGRQNPDHRRQRVRARDEARNFLHFLPDMQHAEAGGRLRSVSRRLQRASRT